MKRAISTHVFLHQRLHTGHLDAFLAAGVQSVEIFAVRHHFDYTDRTATREIGKWFRAHSVGASLHQPLFYGASEWSRHAEPTVNLIDVEKSRRIDAMDEVKRALEAADEVPLDRIVLHLGKSGDQWSDRTLDLSMTAIEHIKAFAHPMGAKVVLETLHNDVATPEHLIEILNVGHFSTVGICLDTGHMHLPGESGIAAAIAKLGNRIDHLHVHDNNGQRDEHCWPGEVPENGIDWKTGVPALHALANNPAGVLEIAFDGEASIADVQARAAKAFAFLEGSK